MSNHKSSKWIAYLQQGATFIFLIYVLFLLGRSAWSNAERNQQTAKVEAAITDLRNQTTVLAETIEYQKTTTFKELEARRKLNLKKPGELVIALPAEPDQPTITKQEQKTNTPTYVVLQGWWAYYFSTHQT